MTEDKQTLDQWRSYVAGIAAEDLYDTAESANTVEFIQGMQDKGYDAPEIHAVLKLFALRFRALGQVPPQGGFVNLDWLATQD